MAAVVKTVRLVMGAHTPWPMSGRCAPASLRWAPGTLFLPPPYPGERESRSRERDFAPSAPPVHDQVPKLGLRMDVWGIPKPRGPVRGFSSLLSHRHVPPGMQAGPLH